MNNGECGMGNGEWQTAGSLQVIPHPPFPTPHSKRSAFTLLEVLLALAILVGCLAILGELNQQGLTGAHRAAASAKAQLYCESKVAEILAGILSPSSISSAPYELDPDWNYSIVVEPTADAALLAVRVTLVENLPPEKRPIEFTLVRWMRDPQTLTQMEEDAAAEKEATQ